MKCGCYNGTREQDECSCGGDKEKCTFHPEYRGENMMPKVQDCDLIEINHYIYQVYNDASNQLVYDTRMVDNGDYNYDDEYEPWYEEEDCYVDNFLDDITAIYRKQGKDYICIWELFHF